MVISPLLRGLFGLETDAAANRVIFIPHVPADWTSFAIHNIRAGNATLDFHFRKTVDEIILEIESSDNIDFEFSPALSPRARLISAEVNGHRVSPRIDKNDLDQHVEVHTSLTKGKSTLRIRLQGDFGINYSNSLPALGNPSRGLRVISESWTASHDTLTLEVAGVAGASYELAIWNPGQIASVEGAKLKHGNLLLQTPANSAEPYPRQKITIHFAAQKGRTH